MTFLLKNTLTKGRFILLKRMDKNQILEIKINKEFLLQRQIRLLHRLNIKNITVNKVNNIFFLFKVFIIKLQ